ncbi:Glutaredoxin-2 [Anabarilius grahami]|uniref:Glutaredoxin-2 n=1 Tax=Anabarilius grahami TaxID=495550 RepID=A0A3N0Z961_ANAGA|nr:Glutaredoxin-2 [Anabarilius grahami]
MVENRPTMKGRVTVYSVPGCPHCIQAKATLHTLGVPVCDVDLNKHKEIRARVKELTGHGTVPQIFFNNLYVGNNEDLQNLNPEQLKRLVLTLREEAVPLDAPPVPVENGTEIDGAWELSEALRNLILKLYSDHLSKDGKTVDYKAMSQSPYFERYCDLAVQLQRVELLSLSREEKLAFFINVYNALVIHGNLRLGFPKNIWQRYRFFNYVSYLIGGEVFTLQDIENGVLRGNRKGVAQILKPFSRNDPRLQVALPEVEPLIHFALNCGAKGCPPIKTYTAQDIDGQLRAAAEAFLENDDSCVIDSVRREVKLSQIFKWYKIDFGGTDEKLLNWVFDHMGASEKKKNLQSLLSAGKVKVSYLPYDWSINSTD